MAQVVMACNIDPNQPGGVITINLVQPSVDQQVDQPVAGSASNKRRRSASSSSDGMDGYTAYGHGGAVPLAKVEVMASKVQECSQYFATCMSERWTRSKSGISKTKFDLEVQTEVKYYEDCFARMNFLYKPIPSVSFCIELLKVASQIGFQAVVDIGVKYLAAAPWLDEEEILVRDFFLSPHLEPSESLSDLIARLNDLPNSVQRKQEKLSNCAMHLLSVLLQNAIPDGTKSVREVHEEGKRCPSSRKKFAIAFHLIVSGSESGAVCERVVEFAMALVTQEAERLLEEISKNAVLSEHGADARNAVYRFSWLFKAIQQSNAAQAIVELLVNDHGHDHVLCVLHDGFYMDGAYITLTVVKKWARMVFRVFEDVMAGKLFLNTSQRVTLFLQGRWLLLEKFLSHSEAHISSAVIRFITTLPQPQQEECWGGTFIDDMEGPSFDAYSMWVSHMVTKKLAPRQVKLPAAWSASSNTEYTSSSSD